jgi:lipopolysaccharide/colanic/teichoic acid biosynthesis glycosyltransferase
MYSYIKSFLDIFIATVVLLLLLIPILLPITLLLLINHGRSGVFFSQSRTGKAAKHFKIIKFKTMTDEMDAAGKLLPDNQRITKVGQFVRSSSIDELPQLLNVIKGEMSLVGPRPLLPKYLPLYSKRQNRRHEVKPGITGWAQVNGRNAISWRKKFEHDVWYVDNQSIVLDLKILWLTLIKVLNRKDVMPDDPNSFEPFNGQN